MIGLRAAILALLVVVRPAVGGDPERPDPCSAEGLQVQVLGAGGPDLAGDRAAGGYLVWIDGKARILIDFGPGSAVRFMQSGARATDLDAVLFTRLHTDRTLDFPALIEAALREGRTRPLPVYGPTGNRVAPSTVTFVRTLLDGTRGAYRYLGGVLNPLAKGGFKLEPHNARERPSRIGASRHNNKRILNVYANERLSAAAAYGVHGGLPALAWRIRAGNRSVAFSGATAGAADRLERLAHNADLFIAHHTVPEDAGGAAHREHLPPSVIGRVAAEAQVKRVVLSHRTERSLGGEEASIAEIRARYRGPVAFADDLDCFVVP